MGKSYPTNSSLKYKLKSKGHLRLFKNIYDNAYKMELGVIMEFQQLLMSRTLFHILMMISTTPTGNFFSTRGKCCMSGAHAQYEFTSNGTMKIKVNFLAYKTNNFGLMVH